VPCLRDDHSRYLVVASLRLFLIDEEFRLDSADPPLRKALGFPRIILNKALRLRPGCGGVAAGSITTLARESARLA